jgi:thiamine pyrophosphokinase
MRYFASSLLLRIKRQDNTDLEKALDFVLAQGIRHVTLTGLSGRRTDFTLANLSVLWRYAGRAEFDIAADGWSAFPVTGRFSGRAPRGTTVSIVPFGPCRGVTLAGLMYPLRNASLRVGEVGHGHLLVFVLDHHSGKGTRR